MTRRLGVSLLTIVAIMSGATALSQTQPKPLLTRHVREVTLNGQAHLVGRLPSTQVMRLVLVLPHRDPAGLDDFLKELYDPTSASYRKFLTVEEFTQRFGPSQDDYDSLIRFAEANGFSVVGTSRNRMNLDVTGSVANIEAAFHLTMGVYQHPTENRTFFAPDREPTPDLAIQLWHITGLDNYSTPKPALVRRDASVPNAEPNATTGSGPSASFLGSDMRAAYYVNGNAANTLTGAGQSVGLFEFIGTDLADLTTYYKNVGQTNHVPITLKSVDTQSTSCVEHTCDDTEQTIDMTQALGMAPGLSSLVMYIGTGALSGQTIDDSAIFNAMATASPLNAQLSCSWNWKPADPTTDDVYFKEFAAQGQSLFLSTGDDGNWLHAEFVWPADSVYVTSVGGTSLETTAAAGPWASETGWEDGGGGISPDKFPIPSWQVDTAALCAACSQTYRNGPDVSANADFTFYVCADQEACTANVYGGTTFSTPMWAGYLALANQQSKINGNPPLGFINPALYKIGLGADYDFDFHDITSGGNTLGTTVGYDLSTGWGSPNGRALIDALAGAPNPIFYISPSPTSVSVAFGTSGKSTIATAIAGGFDSSIALSATGQPAGVTASFSPTSIAAPGSGKSTLTLAVASTTATGTYPITVTGKSGDLTQSTTVTLTVTTVATTTTLISSANPQVEGRAVTFTATVTPASGTGVPTGDVVFFEDGSTVSEAALSGTGKATFSSSTMSIGQNTIMASYAGSNAYTASSASLTETITEPQASAPTFSPAAGIYATGQSVAIADATPGATIYYALHGATPTNSSTKYTKPIVVASTDTIKAIAIDSGYTESAIASATYTIEPATATPAFSPAPGSYLTAQSVKITDATAGATIYYTTNGATPTTSSTKYTTAIKVSASETIKAIAVATDYSDSIVSSATYTITQTATPEFSPAAGIYAPGEAVAIADPTPGATIYYALHGATPTTSSTKYTKPIVVTSTDTIKAIAIDSGHTESAIASASYTIEPATATPVFSPAPGSYLTAQSVKITDATAGATIYYTINGSTPTTSSTKYTAAIKVSASETIRAIAASAGHADSALASAAYYIGPPAAKPTFSPAAGTYTSTQKVTVKDATAGATIYYTTNGATPTTSSAKYTAPIAVSNTETIKAIAYATEFSKSALASSTYTIEKPAATPTFSLKAGTYTGKQTVTISDATPGATIYYTTDGATPVTASAKYTGPITVSATETIKAIALATGTLKSAVASATYTIK